jgi:bifunctional DNA-binding transcriptional regulator/antitoxin component of YhaV-PrlF toxin-antitoxin module
VDRQGRIALPGDWRSKRLKGNKKEVILVERDDSLIIRPKQKVDLTRFFDSIEVDIDPKAFRDYRSLKRALLSESFEK